MMRRSGRPSATIRRAREDDARTIAEVHDAASRIIYDGILPDEVIAYFSVARREALWHQVLSDGTTTTFLLEQDDVLIGFINLGPTRDADQDPTRIGEITSIYLDPAFWRRGFGKTLCRQALDHLRSQGFETASLWVIDQNHRARSFYERLGFEHDGAVKTTPMHTGQRREVRYKLRLV